LCNVKTQECLHNIYRYICYTCSLLHDQLHFFTPNATQTAYERLTNAQSKDRLSCHKRELPMRVSSLPTQHRSSSQSRSEGLLAPPMVASPQSCQSESTMRLPSSKASSLACRKRTSCTSDSTLYRRSSLYHPAREESKGRSAS